ncbi:hypothetical protein Taro_043222 [Colocasia esculenta]|uniref:Uncharacterized protein n=1 Tax=Colocasia esculenta TaxID=4460 RepID=A0A843X3S7_COLES|nr:hypothetical protein [Colocasia esculenta]
MKASFIYDELAISELPRPSSETRRRPSSLAERLATTPPSSIQSPLPLLSLAIGEQSSSDVDGDDHETLYMIYVKS